MRQLKATFRIQSAKKQMNGVPQYVYDRLVELTKSLDDYKLLYGTLESIVTAVEDFAPKAACYLLEAGASVTLGIKLENTPENVKGLQGIKGLQYPEIASNYKATLQVTPNAVFKVTGKSNKKEISIDLYQTKPN